MRERTLKSLILFTIIFAFHTTTAQINIVPGRIIVEFIPGVIVPPQSTAIVPLDIQHIMDADVLETCNSIGVEEIEKAFPSAVAGQTSVLSPITNETVNVSDLSQYFIIKFDSSVSVKDALREFAVLSNVKQATPDTYPILDGEPNDSYFVKQWHLKNRVNPMFDINIVPAWDLTKGDNIKIAIIDGGVRHDLPDLNSHIWFGAGSEIGYDTTTANGRHGTYVAGCAAEVTNNSVGGAGVGWNSLIMPRISTTVFERANDIYDAALNGAKVINNSWHTHDGDPNLSTLQTAVQNAFNLGAVITGSMGNDPPSHNAYPAAFDSYVIACGALLKVNNGDTVYARPDQNTGPFIDVTVPGDSIWTTAPRLDWFPDGMAPFGMTSSAAPQVAGVAALLFSVNPLLTNAQIMNIIKQTARLFPGWAAEPNKYGAGLVDTYQAVLLALAYANKSASHYGTAYNNNHTLEKGYFGKLHEVFHSGGEIFYRRSSNNGTSWEITKRLSPGNGSNSVPSIVAGYGSSYDNLRVVWQQKVDNTHYNIYTAYSTDGGSNWTLNSTSYYVTVSYNQSNQGYGPGTTPVVASYFRGGSEGIASFLLVYAASDGLHFKYARDGSTNWTTPSNDIIPGSSGSSSNIWHPSLASYNSQAYHVNLIYDDRFYHVYSQIFYEDETWSTRVVTEFAGTYNRTSSIAVDYSNNTLGIWSGWNGSIYTIRFRQGFSNGTWSSWSKEWALSGVNSLSPVITYYNKGGSYPYGIDILWYTSGNQIRQKKYYGLGDTWIPADPNTQLLASNGMHVNITHERSNSGLPIQTWTNQSSQPYSILYNSSYLPKENVIASGEIRRAAEITDASNNSHLRIELSQPVLSRSQSGSNGDEIKIPFKEYDYSTELSLTTANVFDYLQTEPLYIPNDIESISFKLNVSAAKPDTLSDGSINTNIQTPFKNISLSVLVKDASAQNILTTGINLLLNNQNGLHNLSNTFEINTQLLKNKNIYFIPNVNLTGTFNNKDLKFSLVNISIEGESSLPKDSTFTAEGIIPKEYILEQNYPNPFNPVTQIRYSIKEDGFVSLKIFDILGREAAVLVNEEKHAGNYIVKFDADNLSSGVYFYSITANGFNAVRKMILSK